MSLQTRTTTHDAGEPLFDQDFGQDAGNERSIREIAFVDDSELSRGRRRFIVLDGLVVTRRRHEILRDFELQN